MNRGGTGHFAPPGVVGQHQRRRSVVPLHAKLDVETVRQLLNELFDKLNELEDESKPPLSITVAFHPLITQGETD